jgi:hypothetical protein
MHCSCEPSARRLVLIHMPPSPEDGFALRGRVCADLALRDPLVFAEPTRWLDSSKELCVGAVCTPSRLEGNIVVVASLVRFAHGALSGYYVQRFPCHDTPTNGLVEGCDSVLSSNPLRL